LRREIIKKKLKKKEEIFISPFFLEVDFLKIL